MDMILHCITMMIVTSTFILDAMVLTTGKECAESESTAKVVQVCPETAVEWAAAATKKGCNNIKNNCRSFQYHCVTNAWQNETIEVCSDVKNIVGKVCAEYSFGGRRIQRNGNAKCETCPNVYKSNESYKYSECYHQANQRRKTVATPILTDASSNTYMTSDDIITTLSPLLVHIQVGRMSETLLDPIKNKSNAGIQKPFHQNAIPVGMGITGAVVFILCLVFLMHQTCGDKECCSLKGVFSSLFRTKLASESQTRRHDDFSDKLAEGRLTEDHPLTLYIV